MAEPLYHYTTGTKWVLIDASNTIKLCDGPLQKTKMERPVAWFSTNPRYEPSAYKHAQHPGRKETVRLTYAQMWRLALGTYRIAVEPSAAPHDYTAFITRSGIALDEAVVLAAVGKEWGANPNHWYVSFDPVPRQRWLWVERDINGFEHWERVWIRGEVS